MTTSRLQTRGAGRAGQGVQARQEDFLGLEAAAHHRVAVREQGGLPAGLAVPLHQLPGRGLPGPAGLPRPAPGPHRPDCRGQHCETWRAI